MNSPNHLEINGNLTASPVSELIVEILQSNLDGSLRLAHNTNKTIIYFKAGEAVFAASNQRQHRIFEMLLGAGLVTRQQLVEITDFTNDLVLLKALEEKEILPASEIRWLADRQLEVILRNALDWKIGLWTFSPHARIKEDVCRKIDVYSLLLEAARQLPQESIIRRYKSFKESFGRSPNPPAHVNLRPEEAFLMTRFDHSLTRIEDLRSLSGLSEAETLQTLYILWHGGFLCRRNWNSAFTPAQISAILSARLELKKQAAPVQQAVKPAAPKPIEPPKPEPPAAAQKAELTLEKYLAQVENGETFYQMLDIPHRASTDEIKRAYFNLAKRFHPDLFHRQTDAATLQRLQHAFSEIAHAYETLRHQETRETYDFKLNKLLKELDKLGAATPENKPQREQQKTLTEASDIFEHGCLLLEEERYEEAIPYFVRALHMAPDVARYHAYYGRLLGADKNKRFKAEAELQAAIKLEPQNPEFRLMLAEFFIQYNLVKRAEGEINRLLAIAPGNREALALLDTLRNK